jgi:hypothetical protein
MTLDPLPARVLDLIDRPVTLAELRAAVDTPLTPAEREHIVSLARWFCRRYRTPAERLAYVRQAYRRWQRDHAG